MKKKKNHKMVSALNEQRKMSKKLLKNRICFKGKAENSVLEKFDYNCKL